MDYIGLVYGLGFIFGGLSLAGLSLVLYRLVKKVKAQEELLQVLNQLYKERFKMIQASKGFGLFSTTERNAWKEQIHRIYPERSKKEVNDFLNDNYKDFKNVKPL